MVRLSAGPPVRPYGRLAHQLVSSDSNRDRKAEPGPHFSTEPGRNVLRRSEQPAGSGEIEKGMAVSPGLDGRGKQLQNLVQGTRRSGVELRVGWHHDEIAAEPLGLLHRHAGGQPG